MWVGVNRGVEKSFAELDAFFEQVIEVTSQNEENIVDVLLEMERGHSELDMSYN